MDPEAYRDARWHSLLRTAAELGVPEEDAPGVVDHVLTSQRRRIRRVEDPDRLVREALSDSVLGPHAGERRRRRPAVVVAAAVLAAVGGVVGVVMVARPGPPPADRLGADQVPSLFGFAGPAARDLLERRGLEVTLQPFGACEVLDRVVASDPGPGTTYDDGDAITVYTSRPASVECLLDYTDRELAWALLDFANGRGSAPRFADRVLVFAGDGPATVLSAAEAADPERWAASGVLTELRRASAQVALVDERPVTYAVPAIRITSATEDLGGCGAQDPSVTGEAEAFSLQIRPPTRTGCPVRVDLYLDGSAIEAVALDANES